MKALLVIYFSMFGPVWASQTGLVSKADEIARSKGALRKSELIEWKSVKGERKVSNDYFELSIPLTGYKIEGIGEEGDPTKSAAWKVDRLVGVYPDMSDGFYIDFSGLRGESAKKGSPGILNLLVTQPMKISGFDAFMQIDVLDSGKDKDIYLRWNITISCRNKIFNITAEEKPGEKSRKRIEENNYEFPADFKDIVSTFNCYPDKKKSSKK